jgi:hypothetical protein
VITTLFLTAPTPGLMTGVNKGVVKKPKTKGDEDFRAGREERKLLSCTSSSCFSKLFFPFPLLVFSRLVGGEFVWFVMFARFATVTVFDSRCLSFGICLVRRVLTSPFQKPPLCTQSRTWQPNRIALSLEAGALED